MKTLNLEELKEFVAAAQELERIADKLMPFLELVKVLGNGFVPTPTDRFIGRGEVRKILYIGWKTINHLIKEGKLTPLYIAGSCEMKFRLSEVLKIPQKKGADDVK